jgi:5'(3')-deoxyribonucleotidase
MEKILVDMDNVLCDLSYSFYHYLQKYVCSGEVICPLDYSQINNFYDLRKFYTIRTGSRKFSSETEVLNGIFDTLGFWETMPMKPFAGETMQMLTWYYDVHIVTIPWKESSVCIPEKQEWIRKNLPFFDLNKLLFMEKKWKLNSDYIIDDRPEILFNCVASPTIAHVIKMSYTYNAHIQSCRLSADSWIDINNFFYQRYKSKNPDMFEEEHESA